MAVHSPLKNRAWGPVSGVWRQARWYLAIQMGTIQRLLCITFMTSQSQLWRYSCIVMSRGPWMLRRWFKRGFGDHRKQLIYEFNWIIISIEIQLTKTANRMAKIITLSVCKKIHTTIFIQNKSREIKWWRHFPIRSNSWLSIFPHPIWWTENRILALWNEFSSCDIYKQPTLRACYKTNKLCSY